MTSMELRGHRWIPLLALVFACACSPGAQSDDAGVRSCDQFARLPALFVHGSGLSSSTWRPMMRAFEAADYPHEFLLAVDLVPNDGDNVSAAQHQLAPAADTLLQRSVAAFRDSGCAGTGPSKIALVTHSMGAVSGRWYATQIAPERVAVFVSLAGSNHGTDALCPLSGQGNQQMCPAFSQDEKKDSIQVVLNGVAGTPVDETPWGMGRDSNPSQSVPPDDRRQILYVTVRIEPDRWIVPARSALLDGAGAADTLWPRHSLKATSPGNFLYLGSSGHDELPRQPEIIEFVKAVVSRHERYKSTASR